MIEFENEGLAYFSVDSIIWTNAKLSGLASKFFPKDPGCGSQELDQTLACLAHKVGLTRESESVGVRINSGFELAVFTVLLDNGLTLPNRTISYDPGGAIVGPVAK